MLVTELGMSTLVSPVQPEKALEPMLVTSSPKMISLILLFPLNQLPIVAQWKVTLFKPLHP